MTAEKKTRKLIYYQVLRKGDSDGLWSEAWSGEATDPMAAKKAAAAKDGSGTYVAVAESSWTPDLIMGRQMTVWEVVLLGAGAPVDDPKTEVVKNNQEA